MGYDFDLDDVAFLRSDRGVAALEFAETLPLRSDSRLRRRAVDKVSEGGHWLWTEAALQQATASAVARHRAGRLAGHDVHDVTCSVAADLVELARVARRAIGSDVDPVRLAMAQHNIATSGVPTGLVRADALRPVSRNAVVLADPARRDATGRRRFRTAELEPPLDEVITSWSGRELAIKVMPGLDHDALAWPGETELISLDGSVREACLWSSGLSARGLTRRATVLSSHRPTWTVTDAESDDAPVRGVGEFLVDPDGAVVRAGLVRQLGARIGFGQLDPRIAYLTGDTRPSGMRAFQVLEHGRFTEKALRATLRRHGAGAVEIKVRGLDVDPDALRGRLRLAKSRDARTSLTVVLTRVGSVPTATVARDRSGG